MVRITNVNQHVLTQRFMFYGDRTQQVRKDKHSITSSMCSARMAQLAQAVCGGTWLLKRIYTYLHILCRQQQRCMTITDTTDASPSAGHTLAPMQGLRYTVWPATGQMFPKLRLKTKPNLISLAGGMEGLPVTDPSCRATPLEPKAWKDMIAQRKASRAWHAAWGN